MTTKDRPSFHHSYLIYYYYYYWSLNSRDTTFRAHASSGPFVVQYDPKAYLPRFPWQVQQRNLTIFRLWSFRTRQNQVIHPKVENLRYTELAWALQHFRLLAFPTNWWSSTSIDSHYLPRQLLRLGCSRNYHQIGSRYFLRSQLIRRGIWIHLRNCLGDQSIRY